MGGPKRPVNFASLQDWTTSAEPGIKYFSGTAVYTKSFDVSTASLQGNKMLYLHLGQVNHIARVKINNKDAGVVWTAPWRVKIPAGALKAKANKLEIEVTNVWANRLIGDEQEPADMQWIPSPFGGYFYLKEFPDWFLQKQPRPSKGRFCLLPGITSLKIHLWFRRDYLDPLPLCRKKNKNYTMKRRTIVKGLAAALPVLGISKTWGANFLSAPAQNDSAADGISPLPGIH